jgi:hypothetical protein
MVLSRKLVRMIHVGVIVGFTKRKLRQTIGVVALGMVTQNFLHLGKCSINLMSVNASILPSSTHMSIKSFVSK